MATERRAVRVIDLSPDGRTRARVLPVHLGARARGAPPWFGESVEVRVMDTSDRATMLAWGESDAPFIDRRRVRTGPPPSEARLASLIGKRVRKLARRG